MGEFFVMLLFGHLVGDYLFQSREMAVRKTEKGMRGLLWCAIHSFVYSLAVVLFLWTSDWIVFVLIFFTHFPLDRWSISSHWLKMIHGRDFIRALESKDKYREVDIAFSCLVYAVVDNTMHLMLMYFVLRLT